MTTLRRRTFLTLYSGQCLSVLADWMLRTMALIWIYSLTRSGLAVSIVGMAEALPLLLVGPPAGVLADRWDRAQTMAGSAALRALLLLPLWTVTGADRAWLIVAVMFIINAAIQFFTPALAAAVPLVVAAGEVGEANSLISLTSGIVYTVAPGAAGLSLALIGPRAAIACLLVLYGGAAVILRRLRLPVGRPVDAQTDTFRGDWAAGIRYVRESSLLTALTVANLVSFLGIGALDILDVVFVTRALHQRPEAVGIMLGCLGAGTIVGGFLMTVASPHMRQAQHRVLAISLTLQGIICLAVSVAPSLAVLVVIQFALGLTVSPSLAAGNTLLQLGSEDTVRGRVMSVYSTSGGVAMLLSMVGGGAAADIWNVRYVLGAGALLILAAGMLVVCTVRATPAPLEAGPDGSERWEPAQTAPGVAG